MTIRIGMLLFPKITQLDLTGPFEVLARLPGVELALLWRSLEPVTSSTGLTIQPSMTLAEAPAFDVLVVPGGSGVVPLLRDAEMLGFLRRQAETARYMTAVCTGSLLLGAAGLLEGYAATTHWAYHELLLHCGATAVKQRVVVDRNRITGGGVTAGIDFALRLVAELSDEDTARAIQLGLEYDPEPPFRAGTPALAGEELTARVRQSFEPSRKQYEDALDRRQ
jgi:cyclohexyl-isocyanide hydratase